MLPAPFCGICERDKTEAQKGGVTCLLMLIHSGAQVSSGGLSLEPAFFTSEVTSRESGPVGTTQCEVLLPRTQKFLSGFLLSE